MIYYEIDDRNFQILKTPFKPLFTGGKYPCQLGTTTSLPMESIVNFIGFQFISVTIGLLLRIHI